MYAVIRTGGKQYRVKVGDLIDVEKLPASGGDDLNFEPLLVVDDDGNVKTAAADLAGASVTATVVDQHRGKKIHVYTYKNKSGQQRHQGHRQSLTRLKVAGIDVKGGAKRSSAKKADEPSSATAAAATEAAEAPAAKSPAAKPKAKPAAAAAKPKAKTEGGAKPKASKTDEQTKEQ